MAIPTQKRKNRKSRYTKPMNSWASIYRKYPGKWVAIEDNNKVVASGKTAIEVKSKIDKIGNQTAGLFRVPKEDFNFVG